MTCYSLDGAMPILVLAYWGNEVEMDVEVREAGSV